MPTKLWIPGSIDRGPLKHLTENVRKSEAISLYREILRSAKHFHWTDPSGQPWNKKLKEQARKEFEESRKETDPLIIARMLVSGRDCLQQVQNKFNEATTAAWKRIEKDSSRSSPDIKNRTGFSEDPGSCSR
jgi:Complex 1 protein (LYR family)